MAAIWKDNGQNQHGTLPDPLSLEDEIGNSPTDKLLGHIQEQTQIPKHYGATEDNDRPPEQHNDPPVERSGFKYPFVLVNILNIMMSASRYFHNPLMDQYLYQRFSDSLLGNASVKTPRDPCLDNSKTNKSFDLVDKVQDMTSQLLLDLDLTNYGLGVLACMYLGLLSTAMSRKLQLLIPILGYLAKCVMITVIVCWHLNINWFYLGYVIEGLCGNMSGVFLGIFLYTSDITPRDKKRTIAIAIVEGSKGLVSAGVSVATGQLLGHSGFVIPAVLSSVCVVVGVFVVLLMPNRKPETSRLQTSIKDGGFSFSRWRKTVTSPFSKRHDVQVRKMIAIGCASFFLVVLALSGIAKIRTLYLMNQPFCWSSIKIGWFLFGREVSHNLCTMLSIPLLYRFFPGMSLAIAGVISAIAGYLMYAFATTNFELFTVPVLAVGHSVPVGLIRGEMSRLFGPETQGPLFACLAVLESISFAMGTPSLLLYMESLHFFKGLVFVVFAGLMVLVFVLLVSYQVLWRRYMRGLMNVEKVI